MVWRAAVEGEARILLSLLACASGVRRGGFFCFLRGAPCPAAWRARGRAVRCRWLLGPPDWVCEQFFGATTLAVV